MNLIEERRRSRIRQRIKQSREGHTPAQLKFNLSTQMGFATYDLALPEYYSPKKILIEEIGWEAYEWQRR